MNKTLISSFLFGLVLLMPCAGTAVAHGASPRPEGVPPNAQEKKDYLTEAEADKIRDAEDPYNRVKLFLTFAGDRLKKFQYELGRKIPERRRAETLNGLLNAYSGCVDDAADLISLEISKQAEIRDGIKLMVEKGNEYLVILQKIRVDRGPELETYKENLDDAIESTTDAVNESQKAEKSYTPPIRRKP